MGIAYNGETLGYHCQPSRRNDEEYCRDNVAFNLDKVGSGLPDL
jgi:hypothetical protein